VAADWEARLFSRLQSLGYEVWMRPHPDSVAPPPTALESKLGVKIATGTFTEALAKADAVILDYLHTSALQEVLASGKPVLTFEFGYCPPNAIAADTIHRRVRFVPAWHDENNRAQTDWSQLPQAIEDACDLRHDRTFAKLFRAN
jgi:hypothetical protein